VGIYKYVVADRLDVLRNGFIRFSPPSVLNDPFEARPHVERFTSEEDMERKVFDELRDWSPMDDIEQFTDGVIEEMKRDPRLRLIPVPRWRVREMVVMLVRQDGPELAAMKNALIGQMRDVVEDMQPDLVRKIPGWINDYVGVLCLTEACDNRLMWSHYAGEHTGFVIEFDESHEFFSAPNDNGFGNHIQKICYQAERPSFPVFVTEDFDFNSLIFVKDAVWEYEREWRIMKKLEDADEIVDLPSGRIHLFALPPACIKGIIFGCRMGADKRQEICQLVKCDDRYQHVKLAEVEMDARGFGLNICGL
jgi:hypothetical protein